MKTISLRLTHKQADQLSMLKAQYGCSKSQLIRLAIWHFVTRRMSVEKDVALLKEMRSVQKSLGK